MWGQFTCHFLIAGGGGRPQGEDPKSFPGTETPPHAEHGSCGRTQTMRASGSCYRTQLQPEATKWMGFYNVLPGEHIYILGISLQRLGTVAIIRVKNEQKEIAAVALERRVTGLFWYCPLDKAVVTGWQLTVLPDIATGRHPTSLCRTRVTKPPPSRVGQGNVCLPGKPWPPANRMVGYPMNTSHSLWT